jgi:phage tail-like protein
MSQDAHANCRFYVTLDSVPQAVFTEVSGLQLEVAVENYEEGGNNGFVHRLPGRALPGSLTLKRGLARSNELLKWCAEIAQGQVKRRNLSVVLYDTTGNELTRWDVLNAYPMKWIGPQLAADGAVIALETLELAHEGLRPA